MAEPDPRMLRELQEEIAQLRRSLAEIEDRLAGIMFESASPSPPADQRKPIDLPPPLPYVPPEQPAAPPAEEAEAPPPAKTPDELVKMSDVVQPPKPARRPSVSLEQRVGTSWLVKIGVVVLFLAAVFFFQYSVQKGWINETVRVYCVAGFGLLLLVAGEWALRKAMRIFAAGVMGGGIAMLYAAAFAASPNFYKLVPTPAAFALMCGVTIVAVALSLRSGMISTAILAQIGAYLTPLLLSTGVDRQVELMTYMVIVAGGFLVIAMAKRWQAMAPISLAGTALLFAGWMANFYTDAAFVSTMAFAWCMLGPFLAYAAAAPTSGRADDRTGIAVTAAGGALLVLLLLVAEPITAVAMTHLLALNVVVLGVCLLRGWRWLRGGALAWTAAALGYLLADGPAWPNVWWAWGFFGLFTADLLIRAWRPRFRSIEKFDAGLATLATALMYWLTYWLLKGVWSDAARACYTAALAVGAIGLSIVLRLGPKRRRLGLAYLGQGLVLLALAVPIAFDRWSVTVIWSVQAAVAMLLASRLKEKLLLVKSVVLLYVAGMHFITVDLPDVGSDVLVTVGGLGVTVALSLAAAVAAAAVISAALLRLGEVIWEDRSERTVFVALVCTGAALWFWQAVQQLPMVPTTWAWWLFAAGVAGAALWRRGPEMATVACVLLALSVGRFMLHDTLAMRVDGPADTARMVVFNWQCGVGIALAAATFVFARLLPGRLPKWPARMWLYHLGILIAAVLVVWMGSFEIDRYFAQPSDGAVIDVAQARQMGLSVWWALCAVALLVAGFVWRYVPGRWLALGLFGLTLGKVLLLDMSRVETGYRILSFFALGALLVGASLLYQRYFRAAELPAGEGDAESL